MLVGASVLAVTLVACSSTAEAAAEAQAEATSELTVGSLRCEMLVDPLGIDTPRPRLSWKLSSERRGEEQTAYRVLVAATAEALSSEEDLLWDSGKVHGSKSLQVAYAGPALASRQACVWSVRVWGAKERPSSWAPSGSWEMGLLNGSDWAARWIDDGVAPAQTDAEQYEQDPAPLMRQEFVTGASVTRARLYISGLGYYEASINGERVGDRLLDPLWTDYDKRVFYSTYDVTKSLREGGNALAVTLGNGWYNPLPLRMWGRLNLREHLPTGRPCVLAQLEIEYADGKRQTIASDESWRWAPGPLLRNNIYLGEEYDARLERDGWDEPGYDSADWKSVARASGPTGPLVCQPLQPIKAIGELDAVARTEPTPGAFIFDFGQNFAGWAQLNVKGDAGTRVRMRFGELLHADGSLNPLTSACGQIKGPGRGGEGAPDVAVQECTYVLRGGGDESFAPRFSFQGFRYVEVTGFPGTPDLGAVRGVQLSCDVPRVGTFSSSNETLNRIHEMVRWTFLSNLFGVQSDCPHRERFGYGGDIVATADAFMLNLDMSTFYPKVVVDLADSASESGAFAMTAPYVGIAYGGLQKGDGPIGWSFAHPLLVRQLYRYYGDLRIIEEQYAAVRRWVEYVRANATDHSIERGLSDHESLAPKPARTSGTAFYASGVQIAAELADLLGNEEDAAEYAKLAREIRMRFAERDVDGATGVVGIGTQAALAIALVNDLVPDDARAAVTSRLVALVKVAGGKLDTGIFGTNALLEALSQEGHADAAYRLAVQREIPGWAAMLDNDATTLWEHWEQSDNVYSHNHPMFGSISAWMFRWLVGIAPAPDAMGFNAVHLKPQPVQGLDWVKGSIDSVRGPIASEWRVVGDEFRWTIALPPGVTGVAHLPAGFDASLATESGNAAAESEGVVELAPGAWRIGSGRYTFRAPSR